MGWGNDLGVFQRIQKRFWPQYGAAVYVWPMPNLAKSSITPTAADTLPPVARAINLISGELARLPMTIQARDGRGWQPVDDRLLEVLDAPNDSQSRFEFMRTLVREALLHGNSTALIQRTRDGEVLQLVPLTPDSVQLIRDDDLRSFHYRHAELGELAPADVIHIRMPGVNCLWGDSPVVRSRATLDLLAEQEQTGRANFSTGGLGKVKLETEDTIGDEAVKALGDSFANAHANPDNLSRPIVARGGMKAETIGQTLSQMEWNEARNWSVRQVGMIFGVPPSFLFADEAVPHDASYTQVRAFTDGCLSHWAELVSGELSRKLLPPGHRVWFDLRHLLRGGFDQVVGAVRQAIDVGVMTQNEGREMLGLPRMDDPVADSLVFSKNYAEQGSTDADADAADEEGEE